MTETIMQDKIIKSFKWFENGNYAYEMVREIESEEDMWQLIEELSEYRKNDKRKRC